MKYYKLLYLFFLITILPLKLHSSASCELIEYNTKCTVSNGKLIIEKDFLFQINDRKGDRFTNIQIPFSKGDNLKITKSQIENLKGDIIRKLSNKQIKERSAISEYSLYEDDFVKYFSLQHTQYPYRIRYSYRLILDQYIHIADWSPVYNTNIPTHSAKLVVNVPTGYRLKLHNENITDAIKKSVGQEEHYVWEANYDEQLIGEIYSPPLEECIPRVIVVPEKFEYGLNGSTENWRTFGNWLYQLMSDLNELTEKDKRLVKNVKSMSSDTLDVIRNLYHYLQKNTRYIFVKIDIGGLKPYSAQYVSNNGYGDCKTLTNYMKSMLDYAGIKSYYTLVNAGSRPAKINEALPSQQFNHVILSIPYKQDTIWLECTNNFFPFNYLGTFTQNRKALIVDEKNSKLVNTPALTLGEVYSMYNYNFDIDFLGNTKLEISYSFNGPDFEDFEMLRQQYTESEKDEIIRHVFPLPSIRLHTWDIERNETDAANVVLTSEMEVVGYTKNYGKNILFDLIPSQIPVFEEPAERQLPVLISYPINETDSMVYDLPLNHEIKAIPDNFNITSKYGNYSARFSIKENKLFFVRKFQLYPGSYNHSEYADFYNYMNKIYVFEKNKTILLTKK